MHEKGKSSLYGTYTDCDGGIHRTGPLSGRQVEGSSSMYDSRSSTVHSAENYQKICRCGKGYCKVLTSRRDHSKGRRFYCCPLSSGADNHGCGMFEWVAEEGCTPSNNVIRIDAKPCSSNSPIDITHTSSAYASGYLEGVIRGSEQQTHALKDVLAALKKLDMNKK